MMTDADYLNLVNQLNHIGSDIISKLEEIRCAIVDVETELEKLNSNKSDVEPYG